MPDLDPNIAANLADGFSIEIAVLTPEGQVQVIEALNQAQETGDLDSAAADRSLAEAQAADAHRATVADLQRQEAEAVARGDHEAAARHAQEVVWELKEVRGHGGEVDGQLVQAEADQSHLEQSLSDATASHELADMAAHQGSAEAAATSLDSAAQYAEVSADQTAATDHSHDAVTSVDDAGAA